MNSDTMHSCRVFHNYMRHRKNNDYNLFLPRRSKPNERHSDRGVAAAERAFSTSPLAFRCAIQEKSLIQEKNESPRIWITVIILFSCISSDFCLSLMTDALFVVYSLVVWKCNGTYENAPIWKILKHLNINWILSVFYLTVQSQSWPYCWIQC